MKQLNDSPKFYNKNGDLSAYSFACGYIQFASITGKERDKWDNGKEMYRDGAVWAVKQYKNGQRIIWETFDLLGEARKYYRSLAI